MSKPKIAVFIDWFLPGTKAGGPVRSVYSLISLLKDEFDFYVITANTDLGEQKPYEDIVPNQLIFKDHVHYFYFNQAQLNNENTIKLLAEIQPDLIYLNSFWSLHFSISIVRLKQAHKISAPVLLAPRGMLGKGARSLKAFKKNLYLLAAKQFGWYRGIYFHATQSHEENDIRTVFPVAKITIAANISSLSPIKNVCEKKEGHLKLFYLSRIARVKNLHFALEILKDLAPTIQIDYHIFGNLEDKEYWQECEKIISTLPSNIRVELKAEISFDKIQDTIKHYHCLYLPTLNENFGHAIVESLLCGCPVIISDQTPWNDLQVHSAGYAIALTHRNEFISAIIHYASLNNANFKNESNAAQEYIGKKINTQATVEQYKHLFNDCIKN
ncbi:MAG: glycosyltransferase [Bacteroidota bacterium]